MSRRAGTHTSTSTYVRTPPTVTRVEGGWGGRRRSRAKVGRDRGEGEYARIVEIAWLEGAMFLEKM